jgi:hypothetical protein
MSIKKFKSFEDARKDLWVMDPNAEYYNYLKRLFKFWQRISNRKIIRGIQKFTSIESVKKTLML